MFRIELHAKASELRIVLIRHYCMPSHGNDWGSDFTLLLLIMYILILFRMVTKGSTILIILQSKKWRYLTENYSVNHVLSDFSKIELTDNHWKSFCCHLFNSLCVGGSRRCLSITLIIRKFMIHWYIFESK